MSAEENRLIVSRLYDQVINRGDIGAADSLITEDYIQHTVLGFPSGREAFKRFFARFRGAFPDARVSAEDVIAEGDLVVVRYRLELTMRIRFLFFTRSKHLAVKGIDIFRISGNLIAEHWDAIDFSEARRRLGLAGSFCAWRRLSRLTRDG